MTPEVNERSIEAVQGENIVLFHMALPDAVDSLHHLWAPGHASNPGTTLYMKWGSSVHPGGSAQYHGQPMTIQNSEWASLNGQPVYMEHVSGEFFYLWTNYDGETFSGDIVPTTDEFDAAGGYLGDPDAGELVPGHITLPNPGEDALGRATYTWDGTTLTLNTPTQPTGLLWSFTIPEHEEQGATIATIDHFWSARHSSAPNNTLRATLTGKGPGNPPDGTKVTFWDMGPIFPSLNGQVGYLKNAFSKWFDIYADPGLTVPMDVEESTPDYNKYSNQGLLIEGITQVPETTENGPVYRNPAVINNGDGNLEAYFSPAAEDDSGSVTGLIHATSFDGGQTWAVDSLIDNDVDKGTVELPGSTVTPFGTLSHMWNAGGGIHPPMAAVQIKWWVAGGTTDGTSYNGRPITLVDANPAELNGHWYLQYVASEYYELYANYDGTPGVYPSDGTFSDPVITADAPGTYYSQGNGFFVDGHVTQAFPGAGSFAVVEVGGKRRVYATDASGNLELFTSIEGENGPFMNKGITIAADGSTGSPAIADLARSGDVFQAPTGEMLMLFVGGDGKEDTEGTVGLTKLSRFNTGIDNRYDDLVTIGDIPGPDMTTLEEATINNISFVESQMTALLMVVGSPDGEDYNHDIFYAPLSIDFNVLLPSKLTIALNGPAEGAQYDQVNVTGTVDVSGAALDITLGFTPTASSSFIIINNDGTDPIVGEFKGLADDSTFSLVNNAGNDIPFVIDYQGGDGNDVVLSVVPPATVYVDDDFLNPVIGVDPDEDGPATVFGYDAFATIQEGINAVAGSTVHVAAGTYAETVNVNKEVSIIGAGNDVTIIQPAQDSDGITITADNVLIKDLKVSTSSSGASIAFHKFCPTFWQFDFGNSRYVYAAMASGCVLLITISRNRLYASRAFFWPRGLVSDSMMLVI